MNSWMRRWLVCGLLLLSPGLLAAQWVSTTNYERKVVVVIAREGHVQEALRQFVGEKTCTGVSEWTYEIYVEREDKEQPGRWVTDEKLRSAGQVKLCKGQ